MSSNHMMPNDYLTFCEDVLSAAHNTDYAGYSKFDALNSPLLKALSFNNKWLRLIWTQFVKECPIHVRPILGVKTSRNPKGIALFARSYLLLYHHTGNIEYRNKSEELLDWLLKHPSPGQNNLCWGYNFIWQNTIFLQDAYEPNAVVTVFVGEALIHAYRLTSDEKYLEAALSIGDFILQDLPVLFETEEERAIAYVLRPVDAIVLNNQVLTGAFLIKLWTHTKNNKYIETAIKQLTYTVNKRTEYDAWFYTHPKNKSPIRHDNYHTGGILDGLLEFFEETQDDRFMDIYWRGLEYYKTHLFEKNGAPRWMNDQKYPYDIHGSAQGVLSFVKASKHKTEYLQQAKKITAWSIENLYRPESNDFSYRQGRWVKWNYTLMRWCNAWMARALAEISGTHT